MSTIPPMVATALSLEQLRAAALADVDPDVAALLGRELERQRAEIELIASENFTWPSVLEAVGSTPTNKYSEGYPGRRYYGGCEVVDEIEQLAIDRAKALFGAEHANVQPHAGAQTNMAVYFACLDPGDTILSLELSHGGHLTHGLKVNFSGRLYTIVHYGVSRETSLVDYDEVLQLARTHRPKLIVCGGSAYPRAVEAERFREIADAVGAYLLCDMAHFAGLVAAGLHPNPVPHCDFVTSTAHKTLAGPRSGFVLCREEHADALDRAVFPGMQGGPMNHVIAAKATCFAIAGSDAFRDYQTQVRANADAYAAELQAGGLDVLTGGTDTHLVLVDLRQTDWTGKDAEERLGRGRDHRQPQHDSLRRTAADRRLGSPCGNPRGDDARLRRERLSRGGADHVRGALRRRRPRRPPRAQPRAVRRAALVPRLPRLHELCQSLRSRHPLAQHKLGLLRDERTSTADFRRLVNELTLLLTYEATKDLATEEVEISTPLEAASVPRISGKKVAVCPILRAGVGMLDGVLSLISGARVGFIGMYRDEETLEPHEYYVKLPADVAERDVIVLDPMLATGNSTTAAVDVIKRAGATSIRLIAIIAAPEGIERVQAAHPDVHIVVAAIDRGLNERGFIVPGLGDAGDRLYGTK